MSITTLKLSGREYVLLPRKEYERLTTPKEDLRAAVRAQRMLTKYRQGKLRTISHASVKRVLGM